ncbi:MAG: hydantoinase B/oxoprolinase family protein [Pseudomonadota bacterium]|nr:hydantoinase B/oxoprolinase family protein [Pseudomonadota bacterium]
MIDLEINLSKLNPTLLAVLKGRLEQIADEMDATLFRSAFNPIIAEAHDASHGLYHKETGETLVQGKSGLPVFVGAMAFAVNSVIEKVKSENITLRKGDIFIFNDPYEGGTHLSDFKLVCPFFNDEKLFCFLASVGHWHDVGGNVPGNYNPVATECYQEGILIPPVYLYREGIINDDIVTILQSNSRLPASLYGDLNAQVSALDLGKKRLNELLNEYGEEIINNTLSELKRSAAKLMASYIEDLPDGRYASFDWLDNDGINDEQLKIGLELVVEGGRMTLDFTPTTGACAGPVNISSSTCIAACYVALKHIFRDVPANAGVLDPIDFIIPADSLLSVKRPKPVGGYTETILRVIDVIFQAMSKIAPEMSNGCAYGTINALSMAGYRKNGDRWVMFSFFGGGHGGHPMGDGLNHGNAPISTATIPPLEIMEAAYPVRFTQWSLRPDSGGPGKHRGGCGAIYEIELLEERAEACLVGERGKSPPPGVAEGNPGARNKIVFPDSDGKLITPPMVSKAVGIQLKQGQKVLLKTPGGGGYGNWLDRDPELVAEDVRLGYVTPYGALRDYCCSISEDGVLDVEETRRLRRGQ